jgi:hypothetical protein
VGTAPLLTSFHASVSTSPDMGAASTRRRLSTARSGPTTSARSTLLSPSSEPWPSNSAMSLPASTVTRRRSMPVEFTPVGQTKLALCWAMSPAASVALERTWLIVAMMAPVVWLISSTFSVHVPLTAIVPALAVCQLTVTVSPAFHAEPGLMSSPLACRLT